MILFIIFLFSVVFDCLALCPDTSTAPTSVIDATGAPDSCVGLSDGPHALRVRGNFVVNLYCFRERAYVTLIERGTGGGPNCFAYKVRFSGSAVASSVYAYI